MLKASSMAKNVSLPSWVDAQLSKNRSELRADLETLRVSYLKLANKSVKESPVTVLLGRRLTLRWPKRLYDKYKKDIWLSRREVLKICNNDCNLILDSPEEQETWFVEHCVVPKWLQFLVSHCGEQPLRYSKKSVIFRVYRLHKDLNILLDESNFELCKMWFEREIMVDSLYERQLVKYHSWWNKSLMKT